MSLIDAELQVAAVAMSSPNEPLPQFGQQEEQQSTPRTREGQNTLESIEVHESSKEEAFSPDAGLRAALDAAMKDSLVGGGSIKRRQSNLQDGMIGRENVKEPRNARASTTTTVAAAAPQALPNRSQQLSASSTRPRTQRKRRRNIPVFVVDAAMGLPTTAPAAKSFKTTGLEKDPLTKPAVSTATNPKNRDDFPAHDSLPGNYPALNISFQVTERRPYRHESFPEKLYRLLHESAVSGKSSIVSWTPCGKAFEIHELEAFEKEIIPKYFRHRHIASFRRQLSMYGFRRAVVDDGYSGFAHEIFHRDHPEQCATIKRVSEIAFKVLPSSSSSAPSPPNV